METLVVVLKQYMNYNYAAVVDVTRDSYLDPPPNPNSIRIDVLYDDLRRYPTPIVA